MRWFTRWYGANPLHLLTLVGSFALAGYAAEKLLPHNGIAVLEWLVGAVIGHDLILMPLYTLADRSVMAVFRHRPPSQPQSTVSWINYLRVPTALSGMLLLIWFPLIFRLANRFTLLTSLPVDPYLWHWLAVTGALFLLSATALAVRLGMGSGTPKGQHNRHAPRHRAADLLSDETPAYPGQPPAYPGQPPTYPGQRPGPPGQPPWDPEERPSPPRQPPTYPGQRPSGQPPWDPGQRPSPPRQPPTYPGQRPSPPGQPPSYPGQRPSPPGQSPRYPGQPPTYPGQRPSPPGQSPRYPGQPPTYPGRSTGGNPY